MNHTSGDHEGVDIAHKISILPDNDGAVLVGKSKHWQAFRSTRNAFKMFTELLRVI